MSDWYVRQFGDPEQFAVRISLGRDPHPVGSPADDRSWGGLALWVRGRCLTRSVFDDGGVSDEVRWNLLPVLQWLTEAGVRLVNEEPLPAALEHVGGGCAWFNEAMYPPLTLTESEEDLWFERRSEWMRGHGLVQAAQDAAMPNVVLRRLGDFIEVSWDNERWSPPRPDLSFVERRGTALVGARAAADVLLDALRVVSSALVQGVEAPELIALRDAAQQLAATDRDWRWLIHPLTASVIERERGALAKRLQKHAQQSKSGIFVPHSADTLVLRQVRLSSSAEIKRLLKVAASLPHEPISETLQRARAPEAPEDLEPWWRGYQRAAELRSTLGWGQDRAPDLQEWLNQQRVAATSPALPDSVDVLVSRQEARVIAAVNAHTRPTVRNEMGFAAALGHLLMDRDPVSIDGTWEHWPTAARARAFGAMLLLPEDGVRDVLRGRSGGIDAEAVSALMERFGTRARSTTHHLRNLRLITEDRRIDLLRELAA